MGEIFPVIDSTVDWDLRGFVPGILLQTCITRDKSRLLQYIEALKSIAQNSLAKIITPLELLRALTRILEESKETRPGIHLDPFSTLLYAFPP